MKIRYALPALALAVLLGFGGARLYALSLALGDVSAAWQQAVRIGNILPPLMNDLAKTAETHGAYVSFETMRELRVAAAYATYDMLPGGIWHDQEMMAHYDADQARAYGALLHATEAAYGPLRQANWGGLSSLQTKIEGTQSYFNGAHAAYNQAAARYYRMASRWPDRWIVALAFLPKPNDIATFSVLSGGQIKDPTENLGNDSCPHPDADGDCD